MEGGENPRKKEKKHKKGHKLLSKNDSVAAEEKKEGKKKKTKKADRVRLEDECVVASEEKKKVKQKKRKAESVCDAEDGHGEAPKKKKKRRKEAVADADNSIEPLECTAQDQPRIKQKKKNSKNKSGQDKQENIKVGDQQEGEMCDSAAETQEIHAQAKTQRKKKKEKPCPALNGVNNSNEASNTSDTEEKKGKVKKKKKGCSQGDDERTAAEKKSKRLNDGVKADATMAEGEDVTREIAPEEETVQIKAKKKKKKKSKAAADSEECEETLSKEKSKNTDPEEGKRKVKMKLQKENNSNPAVKTKRKKRVEEEEGEQRLNDCERVEEEVQPSGKKKKEEERETKAGKRKKKKILRDSQEASDGDVVFLSEKSGNTDEVEINQERRLALQIEVDAASQPQRPSNKTDFGQWSTAQFDSSERQEKFLRLLGGFKKSFQPMTSSVGSASMALGKEQQQKLQQGLLGQFDRAHSRRMDFSAQTAGLGYSATSKKKFYIDVNANRSVRFDDQ